MTSLPGESDRHAQHSASAHRRHGRGQGRVETGPLLSSLFFFFFFAFLWCFAIMTSCVRELGKDSCVRVISAGWFLFLLYWFLLCFFASVSYPHKPRSSRIRKVRAARMPLVSILCTPYAKGIKKVRRIPASSCGHLRARSMMRFEHCKSEGQPNEHRTT